VSPLLVLLFAAAAGDSPTATSVTIDVEPSVISAARALGPRAVFFTARAKPLARLGELRDFVGEVGTADVAGAKEAQALLRAAGLKVGGGAVDLMRLYGPNHFSTLFRAHPGLRLFIVRAREDGAERAIVDKGGGVRLLLRARDQQAGVAESRPFAPPASPRIVTSFGPLAGAELSPSARHRQFDPQEGERNDTRAARPGHTFLVLHLERDFTAGVGVVSFLFGSGIIVTPEFAQLRVVDAAGKEHPLAATRAEGRIVELSYEVPLDAHGFVLRDGDAAFPLGPLLGRAQTAAGH
jgi:hypothetical protein